MSPYRHIKEVTKLMQLFGASDLDIVDTFMKLSPDPFHSPGMISLYTGIGVEQVVEVFKENEEFIRIDGFVWTTKEKLDSCKEVDNFEKLV
mgnify:CR=1 FL=1